MLLRQTVAPAAYPVSVSEVADQAVIDLSDDEALLEGYIAAASRAVGEMAGRVLTQETWALSIPSGHVYDLVLPKSPVQSVSSITYYDADDVEQTAEVSDFYLTKDDDVAFLRPKSGKAWPLANTVREDAITVTFVAGYAVCPPNLKQAVKMMVAHLYANREAVTEGSMAEVPFGVSELVGLDRLGWVGA